MGNQTVGIAELLACADAERAAGRGEVAARLYDDAAAAARAAGDHESWVSAALGAASVQVFGTEPGKLPSMLYDVLARTTDDALRSRLAAALARCWVYAGEAHRAAQFSDEAVHRAHLSGDPVLLADALDSALAVHWGPDELDVRRVLARELDELAAHLPDPGARLQAHLWGLHVACETLDVHAMQRQMRALEQLGEESARARFFAATRRIMLDLLRGRTDTAASLLVVAEKASAESLLPDAPLVLQAIRAYSAIQAGEPEAVAVMAAGGEELALAEGSATLCAEIAYCWSAIGELDRARALLLTFHGAVLDELPRDVNWLLILQCVLETALALDDTGMVEKVTALLTPYAGRAVINAGAVMFHGTTDDTLSRAYEHLGRHDEAVPLRVRAISTYERIGAQWWRTRLEVRTFAAAHPPAADGPMHLHPSAGGLWLIGRDAVPVAGLRGFSYLRQLVSRPGADVTALDLVGAGGPVAEESGLGEVADRRALAAYRQRLADLDAELAEAEDWADTGRIEAARTERDALLDELGRATGLGGRPRTTGSSHERARVAVKKAITTALARIATVDESMARHLRAHVQTGLTCSYQPDSDLEQTWVLDAPTTTREGAGLTAG